MPENIIKSDFIERKINSLKKKKFKNENSRKTGTVILSIPALDVKKNDRAIISATDTMISGSFGPQDYNYRKVYFLNPYTSILTTGDCMYIDYIAVTANYLSRYIQSINQFEKGINNPEASPKLDDFIRWIHELMSYEEDKGGVFILNGQYRNGKMDTLKIDWDALIDYMETDMEGQNQGEVGDYPVKYPASGCGQGEALPVLNYNFALEDNAYNKIPQKNVSKAKAKLTALLSVFSAFNSQQHATAFVGGHGVLSSMEHGKSSSPDIGYSIHDGRKLSSLKGLQLFLQERYTRGNRTGDVEELFELKADDDTIDKKIEEKIEETILEYENHKHKYDIRDTLISVGSYNKNLAISRWKKPDEIRINDDASERTLKTLNNLYKNIKIDEINLEEIDIGTEPQTELGTAIQLYEDAVEEFNNMIIAYKAKCKADPDEKGFYKGKKSFDGVVILRYLSPAELKFKEHIGAVELIDKSKAGFTSIASDGGLISRQLERDLYMSFINELSDHEESNLESIIGDAYEFPIKQIFFIDSAKFENRYNVAGFEAIGVKVGENSSDIIKMDLQGLSEQEDIKVAGPVSNWYIAEEYLKALPKKAFNEDVCYHSGIMALYTALCNNIEADGDLETIKKEKKMILEDMKKKVEIVHLTYQRDTYNSKLSQGRISNIIGNIIGIEELG